jgi:glutathione S-transferase
MITLYGFGPAPGLPDLSPFVIKTMLMLKLAGLDFVVDVKGFRKAPKGKLPYVDDNGVVIADSTLIRFHLEKNRGVDLDGGLSERERAQSWAIEKLCEDNLLWIVAARRWNNDDNFRRGLGPYFDKLLPPPLRAPAKWFMRRKMAYRFWEQGVGRFTVDELDEIGRRDVAALATLIGDGPFLMGERPCAADATVFATLTLLMDPATDCRSRDTALAAPALVAYRARIMRNYFPQLGA